MLRLKKSACQFPAEYQFRMILVLTFLLVLLCSCQASLAKQQGPQEQVSCCNGELHEPAYSSHTSLFFSQCSQVRIFWQCCDLHAVLMPHRGETWKLNLPNEEEKTFHIDTQPSKCTGIYHFFLSSITCSLPYSSVAQFLFFVAHPQKGNPLCFPNYFALAEFAYFIVYLIPPGYH